jgi:Dockerin type I domain/Thrombospondin type 3 repeat
VLRLLERVSTQFTVRTASCPRIARLSAAAAGSLALSGTAAATFVAYSVTKTTTVTDGVALDVYTVWAQFNGASDTVLVALNFNRIDGAETALFYHKDNSPSNGGILSKQHGSWSPSLTGSETLNRPYDSYLVIGGLPTTANSTQADPSWPTEGGGWHRPDVPNGLNVGWYNSNPPNIQGRVGQPGNTATAVRLGQFVVDNGVHAGTWNLRVGYNNGAPGSPVQFAESPLSLFISCGTTLFRDIDGDGVGAAADGTLESCNPVVGYVGSDGDNCPTVPNPDQSDSNGDGIGDACAYPIGDLNRDGIVNASDVPLLFNDWGSPGPSPADINLDGEVDAADFAILLANWGATG